MLKNAYKSIPAKVTDRKDKVIVPTLDGKIEMKIPPGTQNGQVFRLKGKGIPGLHMPGKGDQLVRIKVAVPTKLNERQ